MLRRAPEGRQAEFYYQRTRNVPEPARKVTEMLRSTEKDESLEKGTGKERNDDGAKAGGRHSLIQRLWETEPWALALLCRHGYMAAVGECGYNWSLITDQREQGRYCGGVGRRCGTGRGLGVALGVELGVGLGVGVTGGVGVGVTGGVGVTEGVGVGVGPV